MANLNKPKGAPIPLALVMLVIVVDVLWLLVLVGIAVWAVWHPGAPLASNVEGKALYTWLFLALLPFAISAVGWATSPSMYGLWHIRQADR